MLSHSGFGSHEVMLLNQEHLICLERVGLQGLKGHKKYIPSMWVCGILNFNPAPESGWKCVNHKIKRKMTRFWIVHLERRSPLE